MFGFGCFTELLLFGFEVVLTLVWLIGLVVRLVIGWLGRLAG